MNAAVLDHRNRGDIGNAYSILALCACLLIALVLSAPVQAAGSEPAGRVIFSAGAVTAEDDEGFRRPLTRHDVVYPGETIETADRARVEIRMRDNALVSLDAESSFAVERYGYEDDAGSAIMRFLRGTLRTITGAFGKGEDETYRMITPVATIGVRGTQYALQLCDDTCAGPERPAGLYGHVDEGAISVTNDAGSGVMARDDYFHVASPETAPRRLVRPPEGILDGGGDTEVVDTAAVDDGVLADGGTLLGGDDLLSTGGSLVETGGSLLGDSGDLLGDGGSLLDSGGGLLTGSGGSLDSGGSLLEDTSSDGDLLEGVTEEDGLL